MKCGYCEKDEKIIYLINKNKKYVFICNKCLDWFSSFGKHYYVKKRSRDKTEDEKLIELSGAKMNKLKYIKTIFDNEGYEIIIYQCLECSNYIYVGENSFFHYCNNCGRKIIIQGE